MVWFLGIFNIISTRSGIVILKYIKNSIMVNNSTNSSIIVQ